MNKQGVFGRESNMEDAKNKEKYRHEKKPKETMKAWVHNTYYCSSGQKW